MKYTLQNGYDSQWKKRFERGALYAAPIAIIGIVGFASLSSSSTNGHGAGSVSTGQSGNGAVATTFPGRASGQQLVSSTVGSNMQSSTSSTTSTGGGSTGAASPTPSSVAVIPQDGGAETTPPIITVPSDPVVTSDPGTTEPGTGADGGSTGTNLPVVVDTPVGNLGVDFGVDSGNVSALSL